MPPAFMAPQRCWRYRPAQENKGSLINCLKVLLFSTLRQFQGIVTTIVTATFEHVKTDRRTGSISCHRTGGVLDASIPRAAVCIRRTNCREVAAAANAEVAVRGSSVDISHTRAVGDGAVAWRVGGDRVADVVCDFVGRALR